MIALRRRMARVALVGVTTLGLACGSSPPPQAAHAEDHEPQSPEPPPAPAEDAGTSQGAAQRPPPRSTATYEQALAEPESLDAHDGRAHLTNVQLTTPMRDVSGKCSLPRRAKVVIKVAVQNGRAIGVSVLVAFEKPKAPARPPTRAAEKREAKASVKIAECVDRAVRALTWPPSPRRDSFTTEF